MTDKVKYLRPRGLLLGSLRTNQRNLIIFGSNTTISILLVVILYNPRSLHILVLFRMLTAPTSLSDEQLRRLDEYASSYHDLFARADQARSFGLYMRGLLGGNHRKNAESIAEHLRSASGEALGLAQSLQHFVSQSPWHAEQVVNRYLTRFVPAALGTRRTWVVHDGMIPKKGRHSVGVQRQFARALCRKVNCQMAVVISEVSEACIPLLMRLYLPANWLREHADRASSTIPKRYRRPVAKPEVALDLMDELMATRPAAPIVAEEGFTSSPLFRDGLASRQLTLVENDTGNLAAARLLFDSLKDALGLGHFEGRTWVGWHHHAALVLAAYGFLHCEVAANPTRSA
jgi:SRSO17 transposase